MRHLWWAGLVALAVVGILGAGFVGGTKWTHMRLADDRLAAGAANRWVSESARRIAADAERPWLVPGAGWQPFPTALHALEILRIPLPASQGRGGAVAVVGDRLLLVTSRGELSRMDSDGSLTPFPDRPQMNFDGLANSNMAADRRFPQHFVRALDLLVLPEGDGYRLLVSHDAYDDECIQLRISQVWLAADLTPVGPFEPFFAANPCVAAIPESKNPNRSWFGDHSGGRLIAAEPGSVLFTVGDHGKNGADTAYDMDDNDLGRVLRIDLATGTATIFAEGLRNSQGLMASADGKIFATDHGPQGGDEVNELVEGGHLGWPWVTLGTNYGDRPWPTNPIQGRHQGYQAPLFSWIPAIGVSNLIEAPVGQFPLWQGDLLVGSLRARTLFRLRLEEGRVIYAEPLALGERLRDIATTPDGKIMVLTDSDGLLVLRNTARPLETDWGAAAATRSDVAMDALASLNGGPQAVYEDKCAECHALWRETGGIGPHLVGLLGRPVGSVEGHVYSNAMRDAGGTWTEERLIAYLRNPDVIPGALMPQLWMKDAEIDFVLETLRAQQSFGPETQ